MTRDNRRFRWPTGAANLIRAVLRELNPTNLKVATRLWAEDKSGRKLFKKAFGALNLLLQSPGGRWKPSRFVEETSLVLSSWNSRVLITAHIFHEEYVERLASIIKNYPPQLSFVATTPSPKIKKDLESKGFANLKVMLSRNRGRNFGPLLVEVSPLIKNFDYVVHIHSKKSANASSSFAKRWADANWFLLGERPDLLERLIKLFDENQDFGVGYPYVGHLFPPRSFTWGDNESLAREWHENNKMAFAEGPLAFPAGGMFFIRRSTYNILFNERWRYEDFPPEQGQLDGTTQHMIERLLGSLAFSFGKQHLIYFESEDRFTNDTSFVL